MAGTWEVRLAPGRGRGVFAVADIPRGTPILSESPLFSVELPALTGQGYDLGAMAQSVARKYARLSAEDQEEFMSCHEQRFEGDGEDEPGRLMAILRSNGYTLQGADGRARVAIYPKAALINHSCQPNVLNADDAGTRRIVAARDIMAGEEASRGRWTRCPRLACMVLIRLTPLIFFFILLLFVQILTTYIPLLMDTGSRNQRLLQYGFQCDCHSCKTRASDRQRERAGNDLRALEDALSKPRSRDQGGLLDKAESLAQYVEDQGFADYLVKTSRLAVQHAARADDLESVRKWDEKHRQHIAAAQGYYHN